MSTSPFEDEIDQVCDFCGELLVDCTCVPEDFDFENNTDHATKEAAMKY